MATETETKVETTPFTSDKTTEEVMARLAIEEASLLYRSSDNPIELGKIIGSIQTLQWLIGKDSEVIKAGKDAQDYLKELYLERNPEAKAAKEEINGLLELLGLGNTPQGTVQE